MPRSNRISMWTEGGGNFVKTFALCFMTSQELTEIKWYFIVNLKLFNENSSERGGGEEVEILGRFEKNESNTPPARFFRTNEKPDLNFSNDAREFYTCCHSNNTQSSLCSYSKCLNFEKLKQLLVYIKWISVIFLKVKLLFSPKNYSTFTLP